MVISNHKRIGLALDLLTMGVAPYIAREIKSAVKTGNISGHFIHDFIEDPALLKTEISQWELGPLLKLMDDTWNVLFQDTLGFAENSILGELREWLSKWDEEANFSNDDTDRILDSTVRFLNAISATEVAADAERMRKGFREFLFREQMRIEKQSEVDEALALPDDTPSEIASSEIAPSKASPSETSPSKDIQSEDGKPDTATKPDSDLVTSGAIDKLKSWRDIITPLPDITKGRYLETEFAADLWQVHQGEASNEYREPTEFFRRTFLTASMKQLLVSSMQRISGMDGSPIVLLESGFGGGKTHSLLSLYHLFSGGDSSGLPGVEPLMKEAEVFSLPIVKRAVLVGNKISPDTPSVKPNGLTVRTLWGELAYQLGGKKAFDKIRDYDKKGVSPGVNKLRELLKSAKPCLILVDEWVSYARQLGDEKKLPGGTLNNHIAFVRDLVTAVQQSKGCLLIVSLPAAKDSSQLSKADDIEVGGIHGMEALTYLRNELGKAESSWKPATSEEDLEIVRCRLFEPVPPEHGKFIRMTAMAFTELYIQKRLDFPPETQTSLYKHRIQAAFPIHPEVFDRLYHDWSTLVRFQRTRGVLRLMASVIHGLWQKKDRNPIILPSTIPVSDAKVQTELTRYQPEDWPEVLRCDVDGSDAVSRKIDSDNAHLGQLDAARRVARTICIGSSPVAEGLQQGINEQRIMLGCVMPGESPAIFQDAIRHLSEESVFLNREEGHFWYSSRPSLTGMAFEKAKALADDTKTVAAELRKKIETQLGKHPDLAGTHLAGGPAEVIPDDMKCRLVVLPADQPFSNDTDNPAIYTAKSILETCGKNKRKNRNTLVFLAADAAGIDDLDESMRLFLAWDAIQNEKEDLKLDDEQLQQVKDHRRANENKINKRIHAAYKWVLLPTRTDAEQPETWKAVALDRADTLAESAALTLRDKMLLLSAIDATTLQTYLNELSLWDGDHVPVQQLLRCMAEMTHLPKVAGPKVLLDAIREGVAMPAWEEDSFAFADGFNKDSGVFEGLKAGEKIEIPDDTKGVLVRAERAARQLAPETKVVATTEASADDAKAAEGAAEKIAAPAAAKESDAVRESAKKEYEKPELIPLKITGGINGSHEKSPVNGKNGDSEAVRAENGGPDSGKRNGKRASNGQEEADTNSAGDSGESDAVSSDDSEMDLRAFKQRVTLDADHAGYEAGLITELLIQHLSEKAGVEVSVTLEINAKLPDGLEQELARIMMECVKPRKVRKLELVNG